LNLLQTDLFIAGIVGQKEEQKDPETTNSFPSKNRSKGGFLF